MGNKGNTCLHPQPMLLGLSTLVHFIILQVITSFQSFPSFITIVKTSRSHIHGIKTVSMFDFILWYVLYILISFQLTICLQTCFSLVQFNHVMICGVFEKDGLYYLQSLHKSSTLHTIIFPYLCHCHLDHPSSIRLRQLILHYLPLLTLIVKHMSSIKSQAYF